MRIAASRGSALPETALFISLALAVILGAAQMTFLGLSQLSADGAAFLAAHTVASNPNANPSEVVPSVFPRIHADDISTSTPSPDSVQSFIRKNVSALSIVPGAPSSIEISASDLELQPASPSATPAPFSIRIDATLRNYCPPGAGCAYPSSYSMYIAQQPSTGGHGINGQWSEWMCHDGYYAQLKFPASRPTGGISGSSYDPNKKNTAENAIYSWDTGTHACS
jgi:hypothetical protein